jgi:hypothetical protein
MILTDFYNIFSTKKNTENMFGQGIEIKTFLNPQQQHEDNLYVGKNRIFMAMAGGPRPKDYKNITEKGQL